jgi:hypothetical protein
MHKKPIKKELGLTVPNTSLNDRLHDAMASAQATRDLILDAIDDLDPDSESELEELLREELCRLLETTNMTQYNLIRVADGLMARPGASLIGRVIITIRRNDREEEENDDSE